VSVPTLQGHASGKEIKDFYESLINKQFGDVHECDVPESSVPDDNSTVNKKISRLKKRKTSSNDSNQSPALSVNSTSLSQQTVTREQRQYYQLLKSSQFGNLSDVESLLKKGLDVNYRDFYGWTAVMCAAREGHADIVDCLLQSGADVNVVNSDGHTAAMVARNAGHRHLAEQLMRLDVPTKLNDKDHQEEPSKLY
jgi:ankyrin repeat protein